MIISVGVNSEKNLDRIILILKNGRAAVFMNQIDLPSYL